MSQDTVAVIGAGIAGLIAARQLALAGKQVTVYESSSQVGGTLSAHEVGGLVLDAGPDSYATSHSAVPELAQELGIGDLLTEANPAGAWLYCRTGRDQDEAVPLPAGSLLGIPGDFEDPHLRTILGSTGLLRAKLDVNLPKGVGLRSRSLASLVRARMGQAVLERLVEPVVAGVYSISPEELDWEVAIPGLREQIREHGSLSEAIAARQPANAKPGSRVAGLYGGMYQLARALRTDLEERQVEFQLGFRVTSLNRAGDAWQVQAESSAEPQTVAAVVVATDAVTGTQLLSAVLPDQEALLPDSALQVPEIHLWTVAVDLPELDAAPRGTGVLVSPQAKGISAKALTHATVKWPWLADEEGPGTHVLRLSYQVGQAYQGGQVEEPTLETALADASTLLGTKITAADVVDSAQVRWRGAVSAAGIGQKARIDAFREVVDTIPGLGVTGAWVGGNGITPVIKDAQAEAHRLLDT